MSDGTMATRREALKTAGALVAGALLAGNGLLAACASSDVRTASGSRGVLNARDQELVDEIADTLLPTTAASPGAKAAGVGAAVNLILMDCYRADDQQRVLQGLDEFRRTCEQRKRADFLSLSRADREALLRSVAADAKKVNGTHYFTLVRELVEGAYFSSQIGVTKAMRYNPVPGRWVGCVPLEPGQPAWS